MERALRMSAAMILVGVAVSPASAQYRYPSLYDAAREGARQGAIDAENERQRREAEREYDRRMEEQRQQRDAAQSAASNIYWRNEYRRLAPVYDKLLTPEGQAQAAALAARERAEYRAALAQLATDLRRFVGAVMDDETVSAIEKIMANADRLRARYGRYLPGSSTVDTETAPLASIVFDAVTALGRSAESRRFERGYAKRIDELEAEQAKPPTQRRIGADPSNIPINRTRMAKQTEETSTRWAAAQEKVAAVPSIEAPQAARER